MIIRVQVALCLLLVSLSVYARGPATGVDLQALVDSAHAEFKDLKEGANANYIPILDTVPSELFGVVIVTAEAPHVVAKPRLKLLEQHLERPPVAPLGPGHQSPHLLV